MTPSTSPRVLLVDDDPQVLASFARVLRDHGFAVETAAGGVAGRDAVEGEAFDAVISDITMPGFTGLDLLHFVHARAPDVPVVLITGCTELESAVTALEGGAYRYLLKPVAPALLASTVGEAVRVGRLAHVTRRAFELYGRVVEVDLEVESQLDQALRQLTMAYQPIVRWSTRTLHGYEALVRTAPPCRIPPDVLFSMAERVGRVHELCRLTRARVAEVVGALPPAVSLFVNVHPRELLDGELYAADAPLSRVAQRVILEITERESLDAMADVVGRIALLRRLGFRIALDDLGSGYSGMSSFIRLRPEVVKLDMSLIRGIDVDPAKAAVVRTLVGLCRELGMQLVAEGVETIAERDAVVALGCDLFQGFLFGHPAAELAPPDLG